MLITDWSSSRAHFLGFLKMCCSLEKGKRYFVQWLSLEMDSYVHNTEVLRLNSFNVVLGAIKVLTVEPESTVFLCLKIYFQLFLIKVLFINYLYLYLWTLLN